MHYTVSRGVRATIVAAKKAKSVTYCDCVSEALVIQHVKIMHRIILPSLASLALPYFSTLRHKQYDF
jgi:ABC-type arginine transport system permease subunit